MNPFTTRLSPRTEWTLFASALLVVFAVLGFRNNSIFALIIGGAAFLLVGVFLAMDHFLIQDEAMRNRLLPYAPLLIWLGILGQIILFIWDRIEGR